MAKQFNNDLTDPVYLVLRLPNIWGLILPRKDLFFMIYQIIATHNPQDFFNGNEPEDLLEYYEATNENLTEIVSKCIKGGYVVIIYPKED